LENAHCRRLHRRYERTADQTGADRAASAGPSRPLTV